MRRVGVLLSVSVVCLLVVRARGDDPVKLPLDDNFLIKAATCNHAVITISKMAETQGSPDVKAFAVHLGKSHQTCNEKVAEMLKARKIGVLSGTESDTKAEIKRLGDLKGTDFDREYLGWIIKEHRAGVSINENQIKQGKDDEVRTLAKESLQTVRKHLARAEELAKTVGSK